MSIGGGRYCGGGDVLSRAGRLLNALSFHDPCDIGLGSYYSTCGCELKIQSCFVSVSALSSETGLYMSVNSTRLWCAFS